VDFITDAAVGFQMITGLPERLWGRARSICMVDGKYPWSDYERECMDTTMSRLKSEAQGYGVVGFVILGLSLADFISLFIHYGIRGSPSVCQHI